MKFKDLFAKYTSDQILDLTYSPELKNDWPKEPKITFEAALGNYLPQITTIKYSPRKITANIDISQPTVALQTTLKRYLADNADKTITLIYVIDRDETNFYTNLYPTYFPRIQGLNLLRSYDKNAEDTINLYDKYEAANHTIENTAAPTTNNKPTNYSWLLQCVTRFNTPENQRIAAIITALVVVGAMITLYPQALVATWLVAKTSVACAEAAAVANPGITFAAGIGCFFATVSAYNERANKAIVNNDYNNVDRDEVLGLN